MGSTGIHTVLAGYCIFLLGACGGTTSGGDAGPDASMDIGVTDSASADVVDAAPDASDAGSGCVPALSDACASADVVDAALDASDAGSGCVPALSDAYVPTWTPPNPPRAACTSSQIQMLYDDCIGPTSGGSLCNTFLSQYSNATCDACMETPIASSTYGTTIEWHSGGSLDINGGGCVALIDGDFTANGCGAKYEAWLSCQIAACSYCPPGTYETCAVPAQSTTCAAYQAAAQCTQDPKYSLCFQGSFETLFTTVGAIFCSAD